MACGRSWKSESCVAVLPDYLSRGLRVVFCGTAVGKASARRGHYYSGPGNEFWAYLFQAKFTPIQLRPEEDADICKYGGGLTDLSKDVAASSDRGLRPHYRVQEFIAKVKMFKPAWVAFHGKEAAKAVSRQLGVGGDVKLGRQTWSIGSSSVFVLPSASGANRNAERLEGKATRLEWFKELAGLAASTRIR
jgi:double-stranded uracil-DNA glycosylase